MKTIAILDADLDETPLGTRSRLAQPLAEVPILTRTVQRLLRCQQVAEVVLTFPQAQAPAVEALLSGTKVTLHPRPVGAPPYRSLVRTARKWSLNAWRGGLGGSNSFDEYFDVQGCATLAAEHQAHAVMTLQPGAALLDPVLADAMVKHAERHAEEVRMTFAQAPPGLVPTILQTALCQELATNRVPPGWTLAYKPETPALDLAFKPCCFGVSGPIRHSSGRLTADTSRSIRAMEALIEAGADGDAESVARWLLEREASTPEPLPREVEIELTTEDPIPETPLRPRGAQVPPRGPIDLGHVQRLAAELAAEDDSLVVVGGHGDPVLHAQFGEVLTCLRDAGVYGIAVYTTGQSLSNEAIEAIVAARIDVVVFQIDAWSDATYERLTGGAQLATVKEAMNRLIQARQEAGQTEPIIVPQITKCTENVEELDAFFDGWMQLQGCATVRGFSTFGGQSRVGGRLRDLSVVDMTPPTRTPCQRVMSRCVVLADGSVVPCDQDFTGQLLLGHLGKQTLQEVWSGARAECLRHNHAQGHADTELLCGPCAEWHRP